MDLPDFFAELESHKEALGIDEYSLSQATLEHVFIALAGASASPSEEQQE